MISQTQRQTIEEIVRRVEDGKPVDMGLIFSRLKADSLNFNERVAFGEELYGRTLPAVKRNIEKMKRRFEEDASIRKEYSRKYGAVDFLPGIGLITNEIRANRLKDKNPLFYDWANYGSFKSKLAIKAFTIYQCVTTGVAVISLFSSLTK